MTADAPPAVTLSRWQHPRYGPRWTITEGDRTLLTFGSELEARRACRAYGWLVVAATDGLGGEEGVGGERD
jgi:hypothetical protein